MWHDACFAKITVAAPVTMSPAGTAWEESRSPDGLLAVEDG
jgi:hypothetical protein